MSIMTRLVRVFKADIHSVIDRLEDKSHLLKQCFRDMEEALVQKESRLKKMITSRDQIKREEEKYLHEIEKLEQDMIAAIHKDKNDIARLLIKNVKSLTVHREELEDHLEILEYRITQSQDCIAEQRLRYKQLHLRAKEYFRRKEHEQWNKTLFPVLPSGIIQQPSEEEVELELVQLKEAIKGGVYQ